MATWTMPMYTAASPGNLLPKFSAPADGGTIARRASLLQSRTGVTEKDATLSLVAARARGVAGTLPAVLLLYAGEVVSRERLIDELWGESPPATAAKALNVHVSQLRRTLARNGHEPIETRAPGYAIELEPERLDAARFERLIAAA